TAQRRTYPARRFAWRRVSSLFVLSDQRRLDRRRSFGTALCATPALRAWLGIRRSLRTRTNLSRSHRGRMGTLGYWARPSSCGSEDDLVRCSPFASSLNSSPPGEELRSISI